MKNLIEITPNCFIVKNSDGFKELLKRLDCIETGYFDYHYDVRHLTDDEDTVDHIEAIPQCDSDTGEELYNDDGTMKMWDIKYYKQYPIKYPCLITVQDDTFDCQTYALYIKYIIDLNMNDFYEDKDNRNL